MNMLLTKHIEKEEGKTHAESVAAYVKAWENSKYLLRPFVEMLKERVKSLENVGESDFDTPNHYAKLMFKAGRKQETEFLLSLLPNSLKDEV